jgi:hypothetical protein
VAERAQSIVRTHAQRRRKLVGGLGGLGLPAGPSAFSTAGAIIGPHAGPPDTVGRAQSIVRIHAQRRGRSPSLQRGPLSGHALCRLGWRAALKVSRAFTPSGGTGGGAPSGNQDASRYRPHAVPPGVGAALKVSCALTSSGAGRLLYSGGHYRAPAVPPDTVGRAQSIARTHAQRGNWGRSPQRQPRREPSPWVSRTRRR